MILNKILNRKLERIKEKKKIRPLNELFHIAKEKINNRRDFISRIGRANSINIIAEFKRNSPSRGKIIDENSPSRIARIYENNGASAISVLTEEDFFSGKLEDLTEVRMSTGIPILRKDFIIDEYQIHETATIPADAVLLIVRALDPIQLKDFYQISREYKITPLVEVHTEKELEIALKMEPEIIGINNRDLDTLKVDLNVTRKLKPLIPAPVITVAESGISDRDIIGEFKAIGVHAFLIGESLLTANDIGKKLRLLCS